MLKEYCPKTIYMADDDDDDRMLFADALAELELPVQLKQAPDGQRLLDMLYQGAGQLPEIIFLDINMPGRSGFECLKDIKNAGRDFRGAKVVMLSTSSSPENIEMSYGLGADLYAVKPSSFQALKELLYHILTLDWDKNEK